MCTYERWSKSSTGALDFTVTLFTSLWSPSNRNLKNSWASCWLKHRYDKTWIFCHTCLSWSWSCITLLLTCCIYDNGVILLFCQHKNKFLKFFSTLSNTIIKKILKTRFEQQIIASISILISEKSNRILWSFCIKQKQVSGNKKFPWTNSFFMFHVKLLDYYY